MHRAGCSDAGVWAYGRDERPWGSGAPPANWYQFSPDRKGQHPKDHLAKYQGWMHADGYAGFEDIYRSGDIKEVTCMAHVRRKFVDVHRAQSSAIADEAIKRIAQLCPVEKAVRGSPPDKRVDIQQAQAKPIFDDLKAWLHAQLPSISGKSPLAGAIRYAQTRMAQLRPYLGHGILELCTDAFEQPFFKLFWVSAVDLSRLQPFLRRLFLRFRPRPSLALAVP